MLHLRRGQRGLGAFVLTCSIFWLTTIGDGLHRWAAGVAPMRGRTLVLLLTGVATGQPALLHGGGGTAVLLGARRRGCRGRVVVVLLSAVATVLIVCLLMWSDP